MSTPATGPSTTDGPVVVPRGTRLPDGPDRVVPTWTDPVVRQASEAVGGPWGRFAVTGRALFWTPLRVCLLFAALALALAWIKQAPCSDGDWTGNVQYTHLCYSDAVPLFGAHGLADGALPHLDVAVDQPVLTGGFTATAAALAAAYDRAAAGWTLLPAVPPVQSYYLVTCLLLTGCAFLLVRSTLALAGRRPWDAALIGLAPLLVVHAFTGWELFAVALAMLGLWSWASRRPALAGVLTGLAAAAAFPAALLLLALLLVCFRAGRLRTGLRTALAAVGTWLAVVLPVALAGPAGWSVLPALPGVAEADPDSLWSIVLQLAGSPAVAGGAVPAVLDVAVTGVLLAAIAAVAWLTRVAPVRPRVPQVAFLLVAVVLLAGTSWSPQQSLWLLPLAVLARPRWRSLLAWQATEAVLWVPRMLWYLGADDRGVDAEWFFVAVGLRDVAVLVLVALVVRDVLVPDRDVVRTSWPGVDDPAGGVLDHHVDALRASPRPRAVPHGRWAPPSLARGTLRTPLLTTGEESRPQGRP